MAMVDTFSDKQLVQAIDVPDGKLEPDVIEQDPDKYTFKYPVDSEYKCKTLRVWSFSAPHHRSFHLNWVSFFLSFFSTFAPAALLPVIRDNLNLTKPQVTNAGIAAVTGTIFMRIAMGTICDTLGPRLGAAALMLASSTPVFGMAMVNSYGGFVASRLFIGFSLATFVSCQFWCSVMFTPKVVGTANAVAGGWGNMGGGVTLLIMPLIYEGFQQIHANFIAWRVSFFVPASANILIAIVILAFAQDLPLGNYRALKKSGDMNKPNSLRTIQMAITNYRTWVLTLTYGYCFGVELTIENVISAYFHDHFHLSLQLSGILGSLFGLQNLYARFLGGFISDRVNKRWGMRGRIWVLFTVQLLGGVLCIVLGSVGQTLAGTIVTLVFFSLFCFMACGATYGVVPFVSRRALGFVCGLVGAGGSAGSAITQAAFFTNASWSTQSGFQYMGALVCGVSLLVLLLWFPMWGGAFCGRKEGVTEEDYYTRDYTLQEREQGLHREILKFANESQSQRGMRKLLPSKEAAHNHTEELKVEENKV